MPFYNLLKYGYTVYMKYPDARPVKTGICSVNYSLFTSSVLAGDFLFPFFKEPFSCHIFVHTSSCLDESNLLYLTYLSCLLIIEIDSILFVLPGNF